MNIFSQKGSAVAGFVGVLALVLMVGMVGITAYSALNKPTSSQTQAAPVDTLDKELGLRVPVKTSSEVDLVWTGPDKVAPGATYTVLIKTSDGKPIDGVRETLLGSETISKKFTGLNLADGQYEAILRYIPKKEHSPILRDKKPFTIGNVPNVGVGKNLVENGNFESWKDKEFKFCGWQGVSNPKMSAAPEFWDFRLCYDQNKILVEKSSLHQDGSYSVRLNPVSGIGLVRPSIKIPLTKLKTVGGSGPDDPNTKYETLPNGQYSLSFWSRDNGGTVMVYGKKEYPQEYYLQDTFGKGQQGWIKSNYSFRVDDSPRSAYWLEFTIPSGSSWIDDVSLTKVD